MGESEGAGGVQADDRRGEPDACSEAMSVTLLRREMRPSLEARGSEARGSTLTLQGSCIYGGVRRRAFPTAASP
jgi:hypothetical protein